MESPLFLEVTAWAALVGDQALGACAELADIPPAHRRRLPPFARSALRCALPLLRAAPRNTVVYVSEQGDLESTVTLLSDLARKELISPALFALSVHNGPAGALSLCVAPAGDHTALAGDDATLAAGLTEAYARLACEECAALVLIYAEQQLPEIYREFENSGAPGVFLALELRPAAGPGGAHAAIGPGRDGARAMALALAAGLRRIAFAPPRVGALAA